jgi:hypothetical protein
MAYCIYNYLYSERSSVSVHGMTNSMKNLLFLRTAVFFLRGNSTANLLLLCLFCEIVLECAVVQLIEALRYKPEMPQFRFSMG